MTKADPYEKAVAQIVEDISTRVRNKTLATIYHHLSQQRKHAKKPFSLEAIGEPFGVSRQYLHQLVRRYYPED